MINQTGWNKYFPKDLGQRKDKDNKWKGRYVCLISKKDPGHKNMFAKLGKKTAKGRHWPRFVDMVVNFEYIQKIHYSLIINLAYLMLTLTIYVKSRKNTETNLSSYH